MKKEKVIPKKNYIKFSLICIITLLAVFYANTWYKNYQINKLNNTYIKDKINAINYDELDTYLIENPNLIVYVGENNNQECYEFEKYLYKIIKKNDLIDDTIFLDLSNNYSITLLNNIQQKYYSKDLKTDLNNIPALLVIQNKEIKDILIKEENIKITEDKIVQILEEFEYIK